MTEFCDSFGIYVTAPLAVGGGPSAASLATRWQWAGFGASVDPTHGPRGGPCLYMPWNSAVAKTHKHHRTYTQGFRLSMSQIGGVGGSDGGGLSVFLNCGQTLLTLAVNGDGSLFVYGNGLPGTVVCETTGPVVTADTSCYLEWTATLTDTHVDMNADVEVWINNTSVCKGSNVLGRTADTLTSLTATFNRVFLLSGVNTSGHAFISDYYLTTGEGPTNMGRLGGSLSPYGVLVEPFFASADGTTLDWTPDTGLTHYDRVNEVVADMDASYNYTSTVNAVDSYVWQTLPTFIGTIQSVQLSFIARSDDEGTRIIKANIGPDGTEFQGSPFPLCSTYFYQHHAFDVDPATGVRWLQPAFNTKNFGVTLTT